MNTDRDGRYRIVKTYTTDPAPQQRAGAGPLPVALAPAPAPLRAARPRPVEQRRRRQRRHPRRRAGGLGRPGGQRPGVLAPLHPHVQRLPGLERRLDRFAGGQPHELGLRPGDRRQRGADRPYPAQRAAPSGPDTRARFRGRPPGGPEHRAGLARARLRKRRPRLPSRLARLHRRPEAAPGQRATVRPGLLGVGDGDGGQRGQDQPRRPHRVAEHALGLGAPDPRRSLGRLPPGLAARPLPGRHGADRPRRHRSGRAPARLHPRAPAEAGRLVPPEHAGGRNGAVDQPADGRGGPAHRAGLAAAPVRRDHLSGAHPARGELHRGAGALHAAGALGEPGGMVARDDRGRGLRPRDRRRHSAPKRRRGKRGDVGGHRRRPGRGRWTAGR